MEKLCIEKVKKIQNLRKKGLTYKEISEIVGVSRTVVEIIVIQVILRKGIKMKILVILVD